MVMYPRFVSLFFFVSQYAWYLGIESILLKYRDEILKLPLHFPTYIMEGRVKILETYLKSEEIICFYPHILVHLQTIIVN